LVGERRFVGCKECLDVLGSDAIGPTDAHGLELTLMDEPLHRSTGNFEALCHFSRRQNFHIPPDLVAKSQAVDITEVI
jgi:hypothetical protein